MAKRYGFNLPKGLLVITEGSRGHSISWPSNDSNPAVSLKCFSMWIVTWLQSRGL